MLEVRNITKIFVKNGQCFTALDNVSFTIDQGDFIAIVGPSGSGKSTLLHTVGGLIRPDSGEVLFQGTNVYSMSDREANQLRRKKIGFVFQQFHLIPYLTVYDNIKMSNGNHFDTRTLEDYLDKCYLLPLRNKYPSELSVGEKQRTAFIRAIISLPEILLADEPTGNLDPENSEKINSLMMEFHKNGGTVLLVSHSSEVTKYANRTIKLH
jgi:putative ABC transport system ATP-binding protein